DVKRSARFQHTPDFAHGSFEFHEMLQAVIADDGVEGAGCERQSGGVAGDIEPRNAASRNVEVHPNHSQVAARRLETSGARAEVEDTAARGQLMEQVHSVQCKRGISKPAPVGSGTRWRLAIARCKPSFPEHFDLAAARTTILR